MKLPKQQEMSASYSNLRELYLFPESIMHDLTEKHQIHSPKIKLPNEIQYAFGFIMYSLLKYYYLI